MREEYPNGYAYGYTAGVHEGSGITEEKFLARLSFSRDEYDVAACVIDYARTMSPHIGVYVPDASGKSFDLHTYNVPTKAIDDYEKHLRQEDPAVRHASTALTAVTISAGTWTMSSDHYRDLVEPYLHVIDEYMVAPLIVGHGALGTIQFARRGAKFVAGDLRTANVIGAHASIRIGVLRALDRDLGGAWRDVLTPRALEVATLAAGGSTNGEIGKALGVSVNTIKKHLKAIFEALGVSSRIELGHVLLRGPALRPTKRRARALNSGRVFVW